MIKDFDFEAYRKDGSKIWISINARINHDPERNEICLDGFVPDITERKRVDDILKQSEERFRLIAESIDGVFRIRDAEQARMLYQPGI